jgi:hypothetical protein
MDINSWLTGHRLISLPFSDYCRPLYRDHLALNDLVDYLLLQTKRKAFPRVEIRTNIPLRDTIYQENSFVLHTLKLNNDHGELLKKFDKTRVRETIRQATKRGVEVCWGSSKDDMHIFYKMFVSTHHRLGVPVQPKIFFDLLWDRLIENKLGFLLLAYKGCNPIAGTVFLCWNGMLTAKYNASLSEFWNLKANNFIYWSAIKWGCENNFSCFDFGRTDLTNQSLRDFKNGWGTVEEPILYSHIGAHQRNIRRINRFMSLFIRTSPELVCRSLGELLYKHYA